MRNTTRTVCPYTSHIRRSNQWRTLCARASARRVWGWHCAGTLRTRLETRYGRLQIPGSRSQLREQIFKELDLMATRTPAGEPAWR